jgi:hypothetical protein
MTALKRLILVSLILAGALVYLAPQARAASDTVGTYSDSTCTTPVTSYTAGFYANGCITKLSGNPTYPISLNYIFGTLTICSVSYASKPTLPAYDSTGCLLPLADTGTWTLSLKDSSGTQLTSSTFTVTAAVPDLPLGAILLIVPVLMAYLVLRRRVNNA